MLTADDPGEPSPINRILAQAYGSPMKPGGGVMPWVDSSRVLPGDIPYGLARAPLTWTVLTSEYPMDLIGGFVGIAQDPTTLALRPEIGWIVRDHLDAICVRTDHGDRGDVLPPPVATPELAGLTLHIHGGATETAELTLTLPTAKRLIFTIQARSLDDITAWRDAIRT